MQAQRLGLNTHTRTINRRELTRTSPINHAVHHSLRIMNHGTRLPARNQPALRRVATISERLTHTTHTLLRSNIQRNRTRQQQNRHIRRKRAHPINHRTRLLLMMRNRVIQRAMRLHIRKLPASGTHHRIQRTNLIQNIIRQLSRRNIHKTATKTSQIPVRNMRTHRNTSIDRGPRSGTHMRRITRVEATRNVRRTHLLKQRRIVPHGP